LGIGDWGLGPIPNPQSPIPNPQSPIPKKTKNKFILHVKINELNMKKILIKNNLIKIIFFSEKCQK